RCCGVGQRYVPALYAQSVGRAETRSEGARLSWLKPAPTLPQLGTNAAGVGKLAPFLKRTRMMRKPAKAPKTKFRPGVASPLRAISRLPSSENYFGSKNWELRPVILGAGAKLCGP